MDTLQSLRNRLAEWFSANARALPWRETTDPYHIWLSEIILQQTQVVQGIDYYYRFVETYPTVQALAAASEDDVLRLWQGLGYYSRGRNLLKAARMLVDEYSGIMPRKIEDVRRLPGVGPYTQAAILSFAYNLPHAAVDGNVYRVISRLDASSVPIDTPSGQRHYRARATELLDPTEPGRHNQAMIELGALVCTPRRPRCSDCPISAYCVANLSANPLDYPVKQAKTLVKQRYLNYIMVRLDGGHTLIRRRPAGDIWQGLYEPVLIETERSDVRALLDSEALQTLMNELVNPVLNAHAKANRQHRLTHRLLHAALYEIEAESYLGQEYIRIHESEWANYAMPALIDKLLQSE